MDQWLPIATAPRKRVAIFWVRAKRPEELHGSTHYVNFESTVYVGLYGTWSSLCTATHWMPVPDAPESDI